jgi:NTE family protein
MQYDLVFEGGGAKGFVLVGAYQEFTQRGHTPGRLLGTSAGAITAVLMAAGYTPDEILTALNERVNGVSVMSAFLGEPAPFTPEQVCDSAIRKLFGEVDITFIPRFVEDKLDNALVQLIANNSSGRHLFAFVERGGWFGADAFVTWLEAKLDSGTWRDGQRAFSKMTLAEFYAATQVELAVVASDTSWERMLVLNHRTAPQCPLVMAVRMSMSIPLLWDEVVWQPSWGPYLETDINKHIIVDGGMLSNFPIELFLSDEPEVVHVMGPKQHTNVLGFIIDETLPVSPLPVEPNAILMPVEININPGELKTVQRIERLIGTAISAHDRRVIDEYEQLIVRLPAKDYGVVEFNLSQPRLDALLAAGAKAVGDYFDRPQPFAAPAAEEQLLPTSAKIDRRAADILFR